MENPNQLKLPESFIFYLENIPETGMGYQIVDIIMLDGKILTDRIILNSTYIKKLNEEEKIEMEKIKEIKVK